MQGAKVFIDTNVLLYMHDRRDESKAEKAWDWLRKLALAKAARLNRQVLNEATHVLLRKKWYPSPAMVYAIVDNFAELGDAPTTRSEITQARTLHTSYRYSWWDCLLLASAIELGCSHFLTEDLQDGQNIEGYGGKSLTIVDPFAHRPEQILNLR